MDIIHKETPFKKIKHNRATEIQQQKKGRVNMRFVVSILWLSATQMLKH